MNIILIILGAYYLVTAIWPLLSIKSFEMLTGPKVDKWLVYTVSCLLIAPAMLYLYTGFNPQHLSSFITFLIYINGVLLILVDIIFVFKKVIWKTYLIDAAFQMVFLFLLAVRLTR